MEEDEGNVSYILEEFPRWNYAVWTWISAGSLRRIRAFRLHAALSAPPKRRRAFSGLMRKKGGDDGEARTEHGGVRGTADKGIFRSTDKGILPPIDPGTVRKRARAVEKEKELDVFLGQSGVEWDYGGLSYTRATSTICRRDLHGTCP